MVPTHKLFTRWHYDRKSKTQNTSIHLGKVIFALKCLRQKLPLPTITNVLWSVKLKCIILGTKFLWWHLFLTTNRHTTNCESILVARGLKLDKNDRKKFQRQKMYKLNGGHKKRHISVFTKRNEYLWEHFNYKYWNEYL